MPRPDGFDLALVAIATATSIVLARAHSGAMAEQLFGAVLLSTLVLVSRTVVAASSAARRQLVEAERLRSMSTDDVSAAAIEAERERLSSSISAELRVTLAGVAELADRAAGEDDPRPTIDAIHRRARTATAELRRQLGLLRAPTPRLPAVTVQEKRSGGRDVMIAGGTCALATVEAVCYPVLNGENVSVGSVLLTTVAAGTILGRRSGPRSAAVALILSYLAGSALATPVTGGFWFLVSVCGLLWTLSARCRPQDLIAASAVVVGLAVATWFADPDNVDLTLALMVAAVGFGLSTGFAHRLETLGVVSVRQRADELDAVRSASRDSERLTFARDVHDTVSHAIGVVAVQAAAARVSWPSDPERTRGALAVIRTVARSALFDLPDIAQARHVDSDELDRLIGRIRSAGTPVHSWGLELVDIRHCDLVYRVVQEALTNVLRHSPGRAATVAITRQRADLLVCVSNEGPVNPGASTTGYGLVGLRERVRAVGGDFRAGPDLHGYRVDVSLPIGTESSS